MMVRFVVFSKTPDYIDRYIVHYITVLIGRHGTIYKQSGDNLAKVDSFWGNVFRTKNKSTESVRSVLKKIPIFSKLSRRELGAVERILHRRKYKTGEPVFCQNDPSAGMYIILEGTVRVIFEPTNEVLAELGHGDFFGELALIDDTPRSATVIAQTDCDMLAFFRSDLLDLIQRNPRLGLKITEQLMAVVSERLRRSNEQLQELRIELYQLKKQLRQPAGEAE
jgi:CRP-like cAMP-binding protein